MSEFAPRFSDEDLDGTGLRIAIAASSYNRDIVDQLVDAAESGLAQYGVEPGDIHTVWVPGAFELPLTAWALAHTHRFDAVICLGAVVRGETPHFDYVAGQAASGVTQVSLETHVPVIFGVLTTDTMEQAVDRASPQGGNKGLESAQSAVHMARLMIRITKGDI